MKKNSTYRCGGMTLVEIMVAVAITVGMLLLIGNVFQSATDVSGTAMALTEVNSQSRVLTEQIREDFEGFRSDLPFAIIFEVHQNHPIDLTFIPADWITRLGYNGRGDNPKPYKKIRYDRICFFANGDFQPAIVSSYASNPTEAGNLARIFYGQMRNGPRLSVAEREKVPRQILTRRQKILTGNFSEPWIDNATWNPNGWADLFNPLFYDGYPFEYATAEIWKNVLPAAYGTLFFNDTSPSPAQSFIRRPDYGNFFDPMTGQYLSAEFQQVHFLPDMTDFRIEVYLYDEVLAQWRWFPNDDDMEWLAIDRLGLPGLWPFALYWNVEDTNTTYASIDATLMENSVQQIPWFSNQDTIMTNRFGDNFWPQAIRFTFTLYDKDRRRFPEGQTFSYIMKVPARY